MRGWLAVNLFLLGMIGVAAGLLFLCLASLRALGLDPGVERWLMALAGVATLIATGIFGKALLSTLERRSRAR